MYRQDFKVPKFLHFEPPPHALSFWSDAITSNDSLSKGVGDRCSGAAEQELPKVESLCARGASRPPRSPGGPETKAEEEFFFFSTLDTAPRRRCAQS